jgi:hypothetical protein
LQNNVKAPFETSKYLNMAMRARVLLDRQKLLGKGEGISDHM